MKIFMSSDWHVGIYKLHSHKWLVRQKEYFYDFFIPMLKEKYEPGDVLFILGDIFDDRTSVTIEGINFVDQLLVDLSNILPIHILIGNHDCWNRDDNSINSVKPFRHIENIFYYEDSKQIELGGKKILMMPWVEYKKEQIKIMNKYSDSELLFCHSDLNGCKLHMKSISHRRPSKVDLKDFEFFKMVFSGHIHIVHKMGNVQFVGSPMQYDRGDYDNQKGVFILNLENDNIEFIENNISPTFKKVHIKTEGDLMLLEHLNTKKHYVDLQINNSLLVGKRKNRKFLENILSKKQFADVEYNNDLVKEIEEEVILEDIDLDMDVTNLQFDKFDKAILKYSENQEYENNKIKDGVMDILRDMITIYHKEYKDK